MKPKSPSKLETLLATEGKEALQARMTQHLPLRGDASRCFHCDGKGGVGFSKCHMCQPSSWTPET